MKHLFIAILLLSTLATTAQEDAPNDGKSHFRLFAAEVEYFADGKVIKGPRVFRIDMRTGQTWWFVSTKTTAGIVETWKPILEPADFAKQGNQVK